MLVVRDNQDVRRKCFIVSDDLTCLRNDENIDVLIVFSPAAFNFKLDSGSAHQNLKVEDLSVEWDSCGGKVQDIRKEKNRTNSPMHSPARFVRADLLQCAPAAM